ncbi:MAG: DUF1273 family protein [Clostridia bacterium]|nr:DUF1273 family protein [Clostridia bacterium]
MNTEKKTCCFFGHRKIDKTESLKNKLYETIENLIVENNVDTFIFGSNSAFDDLCLETATELKEKYPHIRRVYARANYPEIDDWFKEILLQYHDDTYCPEHMENVGKASYVKRNKDMIDKSEICIIYYKKDYLPPRRKLSKSHLSDYQPKSGTNIAYQYAVKKNKTIINLAETE